MVQNAVFTQTGGGSGNNHHHLRHHHQHHINSSSPSSSNVVLFQRRQSVGRVCRSRSIGKVAESVFFLNILYMVRWLNIEITFAHFLVSFFSTKNLEIIQLKILLFQLDGSLSSRWSRGWEIDRTAGCFHRSSAHQTQRDNCLGSRSPRRLSPSKLCSLKGENPKHVSVKFSSQRFGP